MQIDATPGWGTTIRAAIPYRPVADPGDRPAARLPTVLVVEHRPLVRAGLLSLLRETARCWWSARSDGGTDALDAYRLLRPDVVLVDAALPSGAAALTEVVTLGPTAAAVIVIGERHAGDLGCADRQGRGPGGRDDRGRRAGAGQGDHGRRARRRAVHRRGAARPVRRRAPTANDGAAPLTPREREVRALVSHGLPDKQIAERLHISVKTVEKHVGSALRKTGARNRTELAAISGRESA